MEKLNHISLEVRKSFPWILWYLWKNINAFFFEEKSFVPMNSMVKIREEASQWALAQSIDESQLSLSNHLVTEVVKWKRPPAPWLKCNVGMSWSKLNSVGGFSWVLKDDRGEVLMHSKRFFSGIRNLEEAHLKSLLWSMECMAAHRIDKVFFASDAANLVKALNNPSSWPNFWYHVSEMNRVLTGFEEWRMVLESRTVNKGAFLIAQSVTRENIWQSYIARGHPRWLADLFVSERR